MQNRNPLNRTIGLCCVPTMLLCFSHNLLAQSDTLALEEIIVTAQKRMENINDVPIAITAFDELTLKNAGIVNVMNIAQMSPGLSMSSYNKTTPAPYVRGIGTNNSHVADDPSVAVFIDDVYISRPGSFDTQLFDLQRIEVLRGPQGTLWGKNVAGGAIVLVTRQPSSEFEGRLSASLGNFDLQEAGAYFNGPVSNTFMAKIAVSQLKRDGYIENTRIGGSVSDDDASTLRGALLWAPSPELELQWNVDRSRDRASGVGRVALEGTPPPASTLPLPPQLNDYTKTESYTNGYMNRDIWGSSINVSYEMEDTSYTSITAYRDNEYEFLDALIPFPVEPLGFPEAYEQVLTNEAEENSSQFSQELRVNRYLEAISLDWTLGLYYFTDSVDRTEWLAGQADAKNDTSSKAIFGQLTKEFGNEEEWSTTLGIRFTDEKKEFEQLTVGGKGRESWSNTSGKFNLSYSGLDNGMLFVSYSEGFKSGAFNAFSSTAEQASTPLDPELSKLWEVGAKLHWLQHSLRTNIVLFTTDYDDIQVFESRPDLTFYIVNATATSKGAELDINYKPIIGLDFSVTYAYLDASYDKYVTEDADFTGNTLQRAPKHSYSFSTQYIFLLNSSSELMLRADIVHQDDVFYGSSNSLNSMGKAHTLVNARASLTLPGQHWQFSLWGKNMTDEEYVVFENDTSAAGLAGLRSSIPGAPRTYGVTIDYHL